MGECLCMGNATSKKVARIPNFLKGLSRETQGSLRRKCIARKYYRDYIMTPGHGTSHRVDTIGNSVHPQCLRMHMSCNCYDPSSTMQARMVGNTTAPTPTDEYNEPPCLEEKDVFCVKSAVRDR